MASLSWASLITLGKDSTSNAGDPGSIPGSGRSPGARIGHPLWCSWASLVSQLVNNPPAIRETWVWSLVGKTLWRRERLPTPVFWPGEFHGLNSSWGLKELDRTERLSLSLSLSYLPQPPIKQQHGSMNSFMTVNLHCFSLPCHAVGWTAERPNFHLGLRN